MSNWNSTIFAKIQQIKGEYVCTFYLSGIFSNWINNRTSNDRCNPIYFFKKRDRDNYNPSEIPTLIPILILGSLFFISFSTLLAILTIKFKEMRMQNLISFIPLILGFIFYSLFTSSEYPNILDYTSLYLSMMLLLYYGYTENTTNKLSECRERVSLDAVILSSVLWTLIITIIDIIMIRRIYFTNIEESRQL
ncbi:hypothetical protein M1627_2926 [Sulfolobus islandicus M.16.27]|uniref:Uncharacterized protein n=2 Tax=Saccharolobus islandicus TaxID=43080 RepID=C3N1W4_SACI3|nr:hypothetical protein M1627_2926 [Sulfolobus islandicus M.16.27]